MTDVAADSSAPNGSFPGLSPAGCSGPGTSLGADNPKGVPPPRDALPEIVTGEELGSLFDLSARSIREHRAKGHVVRAGAGYNLRRSIMGMLDHARMNALRKVLGNSHRALADEFDAVLEYRREVVVERDRLRAGLLRLLDLSPTWAAAILAGDAAEAETRARQIIRAALDDFVADRELEQPTNGAAPLPKG